ncbi:TIGR02391 family protein [Rathayibacter sp. VKM Ac-2835]|uniref:TIGR02391 family protein n=1 Tax=Rathayibacter sp. VKM Ac-2835 TaxID=2739043 RepID=UPI00156729BB|nr:TIGR02391 family protein [Rathayibacter sp. VKM Ac-2835]NRG42641.1 TIGR02391 family protein [Rathayibacter sp. VKM Ac-2835]
MTAPSIELLRRGTTDEIAVQILQGRAEGSEISGYNILNAARNQYEGEPDKPQLVGRLGDAWAWLVAHQCVGQALSPQGTMQRVTRQGAAIGANPTALLQLQADELLSPNLSPQLLPSAKPTFVRGDYETAAFAAMKAVEVEVRRLSGLSTDFIGTKLMQEAFKTDGPLADASAEGGERVAMMQLFMGAIGTFKNPASHRTVEYNDPLEAAEVIQLADLLLRMLRRIADRIENTLSSAPEAGTVTA